MIRLIEAQAGSLRRVLPAGRELGAWHAALLAEISSHLSPAHAAVLARPEPTAGGMAWVAEGRASARYADLPQEGRRALDAALGAILSDIRRLAESGVAPAVREAWPALREVPDAGHVFAVDGRPVLAAWGLVGAAAPAGAAGRLGRLDDGVAWRAAPRPAWSRYGMALGILALLALGAGLLLPLAYGLFVPKVAACTIVPGQLEALRGESALQDRGAALQTLLATLTEEVGRRQLLCPIGVTPAPSRPSAVPAPPPSAAPPPRADLPQDRWDRGDLAMLEGCWKLVTGLYVGAHTPENSIRSWELCFDGRGGGRQSVSVVNGRQCTGPLAASFQEPQLRITAVSGCAGSLTVSRFELSCRRVSDTEAACQGRNLNETNEPFSARFRR